MKDKELDQHVETTSGKTGLIIGGSELGFKDTVNSYATICTLTVAIADVRCLSR